MLLCYYAILHLSIAWDNFLFLYQKHPHKGGVLLCEEAMRCERAAPYSVWFASGSVSLRTMGSTR